MFQWYKQYSKTVCFYVYSGILYLNDDFEGGDFFFAYGNKTEQVCFEF